MAAKHTNTDIPKQKNDHYIFDCILALVISFLLIPIWIINVMSSVIHGNSILSKKKYARTTKPHLSSWSNGFLPNTALLIDIISGRLSFCGSPIQSQDENTETYANTDLPLGIFNLNDIHKNVGLREIDQQTLILAQRNSSLLSHIKILLKSIASQLIYRSAPNFSPIEFKLFGIRVDNILMEEAVNWITARHHKKSSNAAYFLNVNSVNLSFSNKNLKKNLQSGDKVFADGSGIRLAANASGVRLKDNINGTDLLPHLCHQLTITGQSLFLLGAAPGIAESTSRKLMCKFPGLKISGTEHGYFDANQTEKIIEKINHCNSDILLVALGSPIQEDWLANNKHKLKTSCALAVGGLFDFYSGRIPRAPMWLRELGLEWVWRLIQDPRTKWKRYLIGNPQFMWRTLLGHIKVKSCRP